MKKVRSTKLTKLGIVFVGVMGMTAMMTGCGGGAKTTSPAVTTPSGDTGGGGVTETKALVITSLEAKSPVQPGEKVEVNCNVSGGEGALSYSWVADCGNISGTTGPTGLFTAPETEGWCKVSVLVKDAKSTSVSAEKKIQVLKAIVSGGGGGTTGGGTQAVLEVQSVGVTEGTNLWPTWTGTVMAEVSSSEGVGSVKAEVLQNGSVVKTVDMALSSGNVYQASVSIQSASLSQQSYTVRVKAVDKTGNTTQKEALTSVSIAFPTLPGLPES